MSEPAARRVMSTPWSRHVLLGPYCQPLRFPPGCALIFQLWTAESHFRTAYRTLWALIGLERGLMRQMRKRRLVWDGVVMGVSVVSPEFIGRQEEMTALAGALRRAQGGEPAVALVGGEAGVGKTRLVHELAGVSSAAGFRGTGRAVHPAGR